MAAYRITLQTAHFAWAPTIRGDVHARRESMPEAKDR
jgi:hypothetical protein